MNPISTLACLALQVYTHAQLPHCFLGVDPTLAKGWASFLGCPDLCRPPHLWPDMGTQRGACCRRGGVSGDQSKHPPPAGPCLSHPRLPHSQVTQKYF